MRPIERIYEITRWLSARWNKDISFSTLLTQIRNNLPERFANSDGFYVEDDYWKDAIMKIPLQEETSKEHDDFCNVFCDVWLKFSDLRFWQFISYVVDDLGETEINKDGTITDEVFLKHLKNK